MRKVFEVFLKKKKGFFSKRRVANEIAKQWSGEGKGIWGVREVIVSENEFVNE